uniref:Uncharacterized protein n=1 Tax=Anguilla anguilla TaxID=7936 RepID=A0A0E9PG47_ANGAN
MHPRHAEVRSFSVNASQFLHCLNFPNLIMKCELQDYLDNFFGPLNYISYNKIH